MQVSDRRKRKTAEALAVWSHFLQIKATKSGASVTLMVWVLLARIYARLMQEKERGTPIQQTDVWQRMQGYTGVSNSTLSKLIESVESTGEVPAEEIRRPRRAPKLNALNFSQLGKIRTWILKANKKGVPLNVGRIRQKVANHFNITIADTTMRRILTKKLGLKYKRIGSHGTMIETESILKKVKAYLEELRKAQAQIESGEFLLVFTDESFIHPSHAVSSMWTEDGDLERIFGSPKGKGRRVILMHYGCQEGWIEGGKKVWVCSTKQTKSTQDYHGNVNGKVWLEHFESVCKLLQARGKRAIFCMDNAPYHTIKEYDIVREKELEGKTLRSATKRALVPYLKNRGVQFNENSSLEELRKLAATLPYNEPVTKTFKIATSYGHRVLFTPPYWPQFQPIEMAWGIVKGHVAANRTADSYNTEGTLRLVEEGFEQVTPDIWKKLVAKVHCFEEEMWERPDVSGAGTLNPLDALEPRSEGVPPLSDEELDEESDWEDGEFDEIF